MSTGLRVGVIGAGGNTTSRHIPGLLAIEGVTIAAVCNRSRESSERVAAQFSIPEIHTNWQDLIDSPGLDAIVIGTWPYMHCRLTLAALAANRHVMCEARMAMDAAEAHRMRDAAQAKPRLIAQLVPAPFTLRADRTIKRLLAEGFLGTLLAVEIRAGGTFLDTGAPMHWRNDFDLSGYNIMSMGIWYESLLRWIGGATRVTALGKTFVKTRKTATGSLAPVRIPEHIDVLADLACGAQLHLQVSSVTGLSGGPEAWLFGSEGTIRFADNKLYTGRKGSAALTEFDIPPAEAGSWRVEQEFVNAIRGIESITHTTFEDGVKYMEFTEAVTRSMESGSAIALPL